MKHLVNFFLAMNRWIMIIDTDEHNRNEESLDLKRVKSIYRVKCTYKSINCASFISMSYYGSPGLIAFMRNKSISGYHDIKSEICMCIFVVHFIHFFIAYFYNFRAFFVFCRIYWQIFQILNENHTNLNGSVKLRETSNRKNNINAIFCCFFLSTTRSSLYFRRHLFR